jgi:maltooligosyltrehalose trehalohydrolase
MDFRLWAPQATTVELAVGGTRVAMAARAGGWWTVEVMSAGPGTDYAFSLDDGPPLPDPSAGGRAAGASARPRRRGRPLAGPGARPGHSRV